MSAMYQVKFDDGACLWIGSADAKSMKKADIKAAYVKARKKAETKHRKTNPKAKALSVSCIG